MTDPARHLEAVFRDIAETRMAGVPILHPGLDVASVGFRHWQDGWYGVLITPWFMNLLVFPDQDDELADLGSGTRRTRSLPSGDYEFLSAHEEALGAYWSASLASPMHQFADMAAALAVAEAVLETVFAPPPPEPDSHPAAPEAPASPPPGLSARLEEPLSRRGFLTALLPK
jgi:[NiFe] hydrogenase assembly HybE family chaperone